MCEVDENTETIIICFLVCTGGRRKKWCMSRTYIHMHIHIHKHTYEWKTKFRAEMRMRSKCARIAAKTRHGEGHAQLGFKMSFVSLFMQKRPTKETRLYRGSLLWVPFTPLLREQSCQVFMGSKDAPQKMQVLRTIKKLASLFRGYSTQSGGKTPQIRPSLNQNMSISQCSCIFQEPLNRGIYLYMGLSSYVSKIPPV